MKRIVDILVLAALSSLTVGCSTTRTRAYIPQKVGRVWPAVESGGILVKLQPNTDYARRGDVVRFDVTVRNVGAEPVWVPRKPEVVLTWTYPDFKTKAYKDNFIKIRTIYKNQLKKT